MGLFYGSEIKSTVNADGTEMISYIVKSCDEKMRKWLVEYFQKQYRDNKRYTIKFWDSQTLPGNKCMFCFDQPQAPSLRSFIRANGALTPEEAKSVISALITALKERVGNPYQCLTPDTVFYDADAHRVQILPLCPAGLYEFSSAPPEIAPEAWKPESWQALGSEIDGAWIPDAAAADVFSVGVLYMELVAGSTDWSALNNMLSAQLDFPEQIIRCCCLLPALRPSLSELFGDAPAVKPKQPRLSAVKAAVPKSNLFGAVKEKLSGLQNIFDVEDDDFSDAPRRGSDNETR